MRPRRYSPTAENGSLGGNARTEKRVNLSLLRGLPNRGVPRCVATAFTTSNRGLRKLATSLPRAALARAREGRSKPHTRRPIYLYTFARTRSATGSLPDAPERFAAPPRVIIQLLIRSVAPAARAVLATGVLHGFPIVECRFDRQKISRLAVVGMLLDRRARITAHGFPTGI